MRDSAIDCLKRARDLLAKNDEVSAKYACLELRFCIEYITYSQLQAYLNEVPDNTLKKWTPKQVISDLLMIDPDVDKSIDGIQNSLSVSVPASELVYKIEDYRFSRDWANKQHNALGSFLHAPTLFQIEQGAIPTKKKIIDKATEVINEIEQILNSQFFNVRIEFYYETFKCEYCKKEIKCSADKIDKWVVICTNPKCKAEYDIMCRDKKIEFKVKEIQYCCPLCSTSNVIGRHMVKLDKILSCTNCNAQLKIQYAVIPI